MNGNNQGSGTESSGQWQLLSGLEDLRGIGEARDTQAREKTALEKIVEVGDEFSKRYNLILLFPLNQRSDEMFGYERRERIQKTEQFYANAYEFVKENLHDVNFSASDIECFVLANITSDEHQNPDLFSHKARLGIYTSCLAQLLTERNTAQGRKTLIYINGNGAKFDYLFYFAKVVGDIVVNNLDGEGICDCIGYDGKAGNIILFNHKEGTALHCAGGEKGSVEFAAIINDSQPSVVNYIRFKDKLVKTMVVVGGEEIKVNVYKYDTFGVDSPMGISLSKVTHGSPTEHLTQIDGRIAVLIRLSNTPVSFVHDPKNLNGGQLDRLIVSSGHGEFYLSYVRKYTHSNIPEAVLSEYHKAVTKYKLFSLVNLLKKLGRKSYQEMPAILDEIDKLNHMISDNDIEK